MSLSLFLFNGTLPIDPVGLEAASLLTAVACLAAAPVVLATVRGHADR